MANLPRPRVRASARSMYFLVFLSAIILRLIWWCYGATVVWGTNPYQHPDSWQFINAAKNLLESGVYTADPTFRDGLFTRVPGYTLMWAAMESLPFNAFRAMSLLQAIVDSTSAVVVAAISARIGRSHLAGVVGGLLYSTYPFAWFWITPATPDVFTTFFMLLTIWLVLTLKVDVKNGIVIGIICALSVLMREYLLVLPAAFAIRLLPVFRRNIVEASKFAIVAALAFVITYSPWPLRNIINHGEWIFLRAETSGSRSYDRDVIAMLKWTTLWAEDPNPILSQILRGEDVQAPYWVWKDSTHKVESIAFMHRVARCGEGLNLWRDKGEILNIQTPCTQEAADGFKELAVELSERERFRVWTIVPTRNLIKALFKSELVNMPSSPSKAILVRLLFGWRTLLLIGGLVGLFMVRKQLTTWVAFLPAAAIYFALTFVLRGLQMRYLLQADVVLIVFCAVLVAHTLVRILPKRFDHLSSDNSI